MKNLQNNLYFFFFLRRFNFTWEKSNKKNKNKKNTTNKTMHKRQSKEKTIEYHKKEQNEIKERTAKMCSNALTST